MRDLERTLAHISSTGIPVLLHGESGSGKSYLATRLHQLSAQSSEPLVKLRCGSLDPERLASFMDSSVANGGGAKRPAGTLVFDEICDLNPLAQAELLAALPESASEMRQQGRVLRSRLICTSRHNLEDRYRAGQFRAELYFRISSVCLRIPPLRRRREDIPGLLNLFLGRHAKEMGQPRPLLTPQMLARITNYSWPGNVRELENFARQMMLFGNARDLTGDLTEDRAPKDGKPENGATVSLKEAAREASKRAERELILKTLTRTRWNRKRAAQELRISYKALLYKLKDIQPDPGVNAEGKSIEKDSPHES